MSRERNRSRRRSKNRWGGEIIWRVVSRTCSVKAVCRSPGSVRFERLPGLSGQLVTVNSETRKRAVIYLFVHFFGEFIEYNRRKSELRSTDSELKVQYIQSIYATDT